MKFQNIITLYIVMLFSCNIYAQTDTKIAIIGTGYVGLVSGAGLAEFGNHVICADIDKRKIEMLKNGEIPIYEPGLKEVVDVNVAAGRLSFTSDVGEAIRDADIIFTAVGTPMSDDGSADLKYVFSVLETIANNLNSHKIIVTKSTVPIGTGKQLRAILEKKHHVDPTMFDLVSNPEFLREGSAVGDFLKPDRLVIGAETDYALKKMCEVYEPLLEDSVAHVLTNVVTAETIKYAANAFLATKLSYINEIANLCDATNADVRTVAHALGLDKRISSDFLKPGPGFGGSCFPKDTQALLYMADQHGVEIHTVQAALEANRLQQFKPIEKLKKLIQKDKKLNSLEDKTVAVLGLAFKANTDDIRYSPAITTIKTLLQEGAQVKTYDPAAMNNMKVIFPDITYCDSAYETVTGADAVVVMTEWKEFRHLNLHKVAELVNHKILVDARNILNPLTLKKLGFMSDGIGQSFMYKSDSNLEHIIMPMHLVKRSAFIR